MIAVEFVFLVSILLPCWPQRDSVLDNVKSLLFLFCCIYVEEFMGKKEKRRKRSKSTKRSKSNGNISRVLESLLKDIQ